MFVKGAVTKGAARPLTRSAKKKKRRIARYGVFALVVVGACVLGGAVGVRLCFISIVPLPHLTRNSTHCMLSQEWRRVSCEQQIYCYSRFHFSDTTLLADLLSRVNLSFWK